MTPYPPHPANLIRLLPVLWTITFFLSPQTPATEMRLEVPGVTQPILVSLPENHDPTKSWPAVFSYHGTNGRPNTSSTRAHTGSRDWIVIGMSYIERGKYQLAPADIAKSLKVFRHVRDELNRTHGLDKERVYVTGYSKGGWMTDTLLQAEPSLAGGAILMGGHIPSPLKNPPSVTNDTQVFIGVGRLDPNHLPSLKALVHYRGLGLNTSFEAWQGLGHDFPKNGSIGLREWFTLRNGGKPDDVALKEELDGHLKLPPIEAWNALTTMKDRPFCTTAGSPWPERITTELSKLEQDPVIAREAKIRATHRQLLGRELKMRTLDDLRRIDAGYMKLAQSSTASPQSENIRHDHRRILAVLKATADTPVPQPMPPAAEPAPPKDERHIPGNPLVR